MCDVCRMRENPIYDDTIKKAVELITSKSLGVKQSNIFTMDVVMNLVVTLFDISTMHIKDVSIKIEAIDSMLADLERRLKDSVSDSGSGNSNSQITSFQDFINPLDHRPGE